MSKKRNQLGTTIDSDIHELVKELSNSIGIPVSKLTDQAFGLLLDKYEDGGFVDPHKRTDRNYRFASMDEISATTLDVDDVEPVTHYVEFKTPVENKEDRLPRYIQADHIKPFTDLELDSYYNALKMILESRNRIEQGIEIEMKSGSGKTYSSMPFTTTTTSK